MVIPIQARLRDMALAKSAALAPVASTDPAEFSFSYSSTSSSFECSPLSTPSAPPPTPADTLTDIHPRKSSFSSEYGMGAACAFPSWPNRPSLCSADSSDSFVNNAYLTDEDLLWMPENAAVDICDEPAPKEHPEMFSSLTMEQQLKLIRAAAEEEDRARFMAKVEAHARATQAVRQVKLARVSESETSTVTTPTTTTTPKRKKRRAVQTPKRRAHSSSAKVMIASN